MDFWGYPRVPELPPSGGGIQVETWSQYWERMQPEIREAEEELRTRHRFLQSLAGRRANKSIAYLMEQQRLLQYYAPEQVRVYDHATAFNAQPWVADVDATFENEFTMNSEGP